MRSDLDVYIKKRQLNSHGLCKVKDILPMKMFLRQILCLIIGIVIGVRLADFWDVSKTQRLKYTYTKNLPGSKSETEAEAEAEAKAAVLNFVPISIVDFLFNETRILCWIMTTPKNHLKRAIHVKNTWGSRCNKLLFISSEEDRILKTIKLQVHEGRSFLWQKSYEAFRYIYNNHFEEAEWFLKADDDTYVVMENLRAFLYQFSSDVPVYFGCRFRYYVEQGYMSGGAGYVLSKEGLRRFAEIGYNDRMLCPRNHSHEDVLMGTCLQNIGVIAGDSRDEEGQERFLPLAPFHLMPKDTSAWYSNYLFYKRENNRQCCSRKAISFHYIMPQMFYSIEYFIYSLQIFGSFGYSKDILPPKANMTELMKKWKHAILDRRIDYL